MLVFLDSNVLVYAVDPRDKRKMRVAKDIVSSALRGYRRCAISVQSLTEFVNVAIKKLKKPVDEINDFLSAYMGLQTICIDPTMVARGFEIKKRYDIQFYDAMMLAAAERAGANEFYTEDLNDGQLYGSVRAVNPFKDIDTSRP